MPITDSGFFNASFEYSENDDTDRSVQRDDAAGLIAGGNDAVGDPAQIWGSPEVNNDIKTIFNMGVEIGDSARSTLLVTTPTKKSTVVSTSVTLTLALQYFHPTTVKLVW